MKRNIKVFAVQFTEKEWAIINLIDQAQHMKGMTRKGFLIYAIANFCPEIAPQLVEHLMKKPKNARVILKDVENAFPKN